MSQQPEATPSLPSTSTFSFTAPLPATSHLKARRVSLATSSSPRLVPAWSFRDDTGLYTQPAASGSGTGAEKKGKMRKIANEEDSGDVDLDERPTLKRVRKKWTMDETQMLVEGCNTWGVGNWKAILKDPKLKFDNRSPVDLKDRFRTYFPDAYKQHYPNAKTHLSSKVRSILPNGTSLFEKTRSKRRRPFTEEEDRALKAGYEKHGTVWATIVKDPVFQEHNRRSTDLRDRFRNAFPELYEAAGYKPRRSAKKKMGEPGFPVRAATDDQLVTTSSVGAVRRKRAYTNEGFYRGGTKSVPESVANSEDEDSSGDEDEQDVLSPNPPPTSLMQLTFDSPNQQPNESPDSVPEADMLDSLADPLSGHDIFGEPSRADSSNSQSQTWSSGFDTPIHNTWSSATTAGSPTSSHLSTEYFLQNSSSFHRRSDHGVNMIGKSAWGTSDWFSPNPRLDASSSSPSFAGGLSPTPSSPFSFAHLNHNVLDRYDLFPASFPTDFASEVGLGETHSTFSDPDMFTTSNFRGFTHHSDYAGDLIFGTRSHQQQQHHSNYGAGFGFGVGVGDAGLGLSGMSVSQQPTSVHPMQLHTPSLPGIDEIELTSISLNDQPEPVDSMDSSIDGAVQTDNADTSMSLADLASYRLPRQTLEEIVGLSQDMHSTPPATPVNPPRALRSEGHHLSSMHNRSVSVPPTDHRSTLRSSQSHPTTKAQGTPTRHFSSFFDSFVQLNDDPRPVHTSSPTDMWRLAVANDRDVPFLDLHYYGHGAPDSTVDSAVLRQGQALDLAQPFPQPSRSPAPVTMHSQPFASQSSSSSRPLHHRGQSAVSPQDLMLRHSNENKRKRASWDGGPA
ncbi:hypothetical protein OE88DRAFT_1681591 [Heliocybe sulcata]|uniref:Myb-like domain-containing protein n=1 Tax=Heliocybe sulcata TaxID=5364 RepID=A0A5C3MZV6_9AGAM|nr:hypothetical protein OE88DRAFT_1681591 [Heliocybe sulcata]